MVVLAGCSTGREGQASAAGALPGVAQALVAHGVPAVLAIAAITFAVWAVWGPEPRMAHALVNAIAVLIIDAMCPLVDSTKVTSPPSSWVLR